MEILPWSFYGRLADTDGEVLKRLLSGSPGKCNILLYGVPGTGKAEFVKYLGQKLDRKVLVMKGSDILSKYVGESEQNIAKAFRRAEAEDEFDELKTLGNLAPGDFPHGAAGGVLLGRGDVERRPHRRTARGVPPQEGWRHEVPNRLRRIMSEWREWRKDQMPTTETNAP